MRVIQTDGMISLRITTIRSYDMICSIDDCEINLKNQRKIPYGREGSWDDEENKTVQNEILTAARKSNNENRSESSVKHDA